MELRHLRYFVAVAEAGSLTVAAQERLHTAQPSLSRQIRDLETEIGVPLLSRSVHGVTLTPAGAAFLDHARIALAQADAAREAARRAARPDKPTFALGFLTGQEMTWLPEAMQILHDRLPAMDVTVTSAYSPDLAEALRHRRIDLAFMRIEPNTDELAYRSVMKEPLVVLLPSDHRLAAHDSIAPGDLAGEELVHVSRTAPSLRRVIEDYIRTAKLAVKPAHEADNIAMAISLVASTRAVAVLPDYVRNFLPWSVVCRPIRGTPPTIDLAVGWHTANASPVLQHFLKHCDALAARITLRRT